MNEDKWKKSKSLLLYLGWLMLLHRWVFFFIISSLFAVAILVLHLTRGEDWKWKIWARDSVGCFFISHLHNIMNLNIYFELEILQCEFQCYDFCSRLLVWRSFLSFFLPQPKKENITHLTQLGVFRSEKLSRFSIIINKKQRKSHFSANPDCWMGYAMLAGTTYNIFIFVYINYEEKKCNKFIRNYNWVHQIANLFFSYVFLLWMLSSAISLSTLPEASESQQICY